LQFHAAQQVTQEEYEQVEDEVCEQVIFPLLNRIIDQSDDDKRHRAIDEQSEYEF
jgi:hypothetical protein